MATNNKKNLDVVDEQKTQSATTDITSENATQTPTTPTAGSGTYQQTDAEKNAWELLQQQMAQKPGAYQPEWQTQLNDVLQKILNREDFSYDMNADALYQQYKDQFVTQGKMAMMDTMGQAQAMTGGYGNSYAQAVGQQAYQGQLQQLNNMIPELYQLALGQYQTEGDDMYSQAALMAQMEDQSYGRYRDTVSDYYADLDRLQSQYNTEREFGYGTWADQRDFDYQTERDKVSDEWRQKEFDEAVRQYEQQLALSQQKGSTGKTVDPGDKQFINYKELGYANYNQLTDALSDIASKQGNEALYAKLQHWVANGFIDSVSATNIYTLCAASTKLKTPTAVANRNDMGYYNSTTKQTHVLN